MEKLRAAYCSSFVGESWFPPLYIEWSIRYYNRATACLLERPELCFMHSLPRDAHDSCHLDKEITADGAETSVRLWSSHTAPT